MKKFLSLGLISFLTQISLVISMAAVQNMCTKYGTKRTDRAKQLFSYLLGAEAVVGVIALIIVGCFPLQIANLFGAANESTAIRAGMKAADLQDLDLA